jgi:hypothetical protein
MDGPMDGQPDDAPVNKQMSRWENQKERSLSSSIFFGEVLSREQKTKRPPK